MSAQGYAVSCHQVLADAGCVFSSRVKNQAEQLSVIVDTGCNRTILPSEFEKYAEGNNSSNSKGTSVELAGKGQVLHAGPLRDVYLPVWDVDGNIRIMKEKCAFSAEARLPLLASMDRPTSLKMPGQPEVVQCVDKYGETFWAPVVREQQGMPVLILVADSESNSVGACAQEQNGERLRALKWTLAETIEKKDSMSPVERSELLVALHWRLAHATGRRLYLTLIEKGWGGIFTEKDCGSVECETCRLLNRKRRGLALLLARQRIKI